VRPGRAGRALRRCALGIGQVLVLGSVPALSGLPAAAAEWTIQTGGHVDTWWAEKRGTGSGLQILAPLSVALDTLDWGVSVRGAYGTTEREPGEGPTTSLTGFTDTTLSGYSRWTPFQIELEAALGLDLPTGKSALRTSQLPALQDQDLVTLERFGEGFDVNPTLTAYRNFGAVGFGLGLGYLLTGEFDLTSEIPNDDLDPGDELTAAGLVDFYVGDVTRVLLQVAYTTFTTSKVGGTEVLREGDEIDARVTAEWRPEPWWVIVGMRNIVRIKSERPDSAGRLRTEPRNSNGNDLRARLVVGYVFTDAWAADASVDVRYVTANDYPADDALHDGGRIKVAFGPSVSWTPTRRLAVEAGVHYFVLDAKRSPFFPTETVVHGIHADLRLTYRF